MQHIIIQMSLAIFGLIAAGMALTHNLKARKWAPIIGLIGQPFWFIYAITTTPTPWGLYVTATCFSLLYIWGIWNQWKKPPTPLFIFWWEEDSDLPNLYRICSKDTEQLTRKWFARIQLNGEMRVPIQHGWMDIMTERLNKECTK